MPLLPAVPDIPTTSTPKLPVPYETASERCSDMPTSPLKTRNLDYKRRLDSQTSVLNNLRQKFIKLDLYKLRRPVKSLKEKVDRESNTIQILRERLTTNKIAERNKGRRERYTLNRRSKLEDCEKKIRALQQEITARDHREAELEDEVARNKVIPGNIYTTIFSYLW